LVILALALVTLLSVAAWSHQSQVFAGNRSSKISRQPAGAAVQAHGGQSYISVGLACPISGDCPGIAQAGAGVSGGSSAWVCYCTRERLLGLTTGTPRYHPWVDGRERLLSLTTGTPRYRPWVDGRERLIGSTTGTPEYRPCAYGSRVCMGGRVVR